MRTIKGAARNKAKRRLFKKVKGYRGGRGGLYRTAKETLVRAGVYAFRDRRVRKRQFRRLWIVRINAACRMRGFRYSLFIAGLQRAQVALDRKTLAALAVEDPDTFTRLVELARANLPAGTV
jgi:large subunit ribosomal protein L20